ncbi:hypothetical protein GLOIN_2v1785013 [Rhizophagus irregularis DAOM 181602=DAOM 197198]|nr:hypothetical protein GLOIN_2v1785013 [Rhizophagus irregularis DAOM 181602=DAOM 197198]
MAFSSTTNISKAFSEGDDLDTAVNRALYYEPVNHAFRKYSSFGLTEEDIITSSKQIPDASKSVEDQPMDIEILEAPKMSKHQSKVAVQPEDPKDDVSRPSLPSPSGGKKRKTAPVSKANNSQSPNKTTKKQPVATSPKTISTVMTGYEPANKDLIQEITVYDISSIWSQLDTLNHLKARGQVVAIKFKSQQKYVTVTVSIELNQEATRLWNDGA